MVGKGAALARCSGSVNFLGRRAGRTFSCFQGAGGGEGFGSVFGEVSEDDGGSHGERCGAGVGFLIGNPVLGRGGHGGRMDVVEGRGVRQGQGEPVSLDDGAATLS